MIGGAGCCADRADLLRNEAKQRLRIEERLGLLVEERLVGRSAALGQEEEVVLVAGHGIELDLRGQVRAGVPLIVHVEWRELGVAQIPLGVGLVDAKGEGFGVIAKR